MNRWRPYAVSIILVENIPFANIAQKNRNTGYRETKNNVKKRRSRKGKEGIGSKRFEKMIHLPHYGTSGIYSTMMESP